jgi:hypothetical protein
MNLIKEKRRLLGFKVIFLLEKHPTQLRADVPLEVFDQHCPIREGQRFMT